MENERHMQLHESNDTLHHANSHLQPVNPEEVREDREEGEKCGFVHRIMLPYGEARATIIDNAWYYAACDALSSAGSIKTYTSNKVCLWKQKPSNIARFGTSGKTLKLDRQNVYCLQLDGITKLLQDKNLADFVHYFQEHEVLNPVSAFIDNPRYPIRPLPLRFQPIVCPQYSPNYTPINYHNWSRHPPPCRVEMAPNPPAPRAELPSKEVDYQSIQPHLSHGWTAFNPVTGAHLSVPLCSRCGSLQNIPSGAAACVVAAKTSAAAAGSQEAQAVVQNLKSKFDGLMNELQFHFIGLEKTFTELMVDMRAQFAVMENTLAHITKNKRRLRVSHRIRDQLIPPKLPKRRCTNNGTYGSASGNEIEGAVV